MDQNDRSIEHPQKTSSLFLCQDVIVAKSNRLEVRQLRSATEGMSPFPVVVSVPINGRIVALAPIKVASSETSYVFVLTNRQQYAVLAYDPKNSSTDPSGKKHNPYPIVTLASGSLKDQVLGAETDSGPILAIDHFYRCIAVHMFDGLITVIPINRDYVRPRPHKGDAHAPSPLPTSVLLKAPAHCRIEERTILALTFMQSCIEALPQIAILHQDARGAQHITTHVVSRQNSLYLFQSLNAPSTTEWLQKSNVDGGSSMLIPLPLAAKSTAAAAANAGTSEGEAEYYPQPKHKTGGLLVVGQRQLLYCSAISSKVVAIPQALFLSFEELPADPTASGSLPRYLLGDEFGNLHMLTCDVTPQSTKITGLQIDTLGSCTISSALSYLNQGLCFVGSTLGDSQLVQIHDEPITQSSNGDAVNPLNATTYLSVVEEYTHLGPILDMDLVPTATTSNVSSVGPAQSQIVTASGSSLSGSLRVVSNGIGMVESAAVEIPGIQNVWSLRERFDDKDDAYLVQSFAHETRVLGVVSMEDDGNEVMEDEDEVAGGATLAEVVLDGLDSSCSTLCVRNIQQANYVVQVTQRQVRLITTRELVDSWEAPDGITVAAVNEAGQIAVSGSGGKLTYLTIQDDKIVKVSETQLDQEISCLDLNPFGPTSDGNAEDSSMEIDEQKPSHSGLRTTQKSTLIAVGLWDDFTVRVLSVESDLAEVLNIQLNTEEVEASTGLSSPSRTKRTNMMARSLCLITLSPSSSNSNGSSKTTDTAGADMLFIGLGDGTLISFALVREREQMYARSRKEVGLGSQRITLIPLKSEDGGTCVLATGDRPTVVYLAGAASSCSNNFNPKLSYSNVNLSVNDEDEEDGVTRPLSQQSIAINVAAPFASSLLYDTAATGNQRYLLCVADDSFLRMGVIDDIQKLHVTKCRLGMAPRRVVHCPEGRLFAVGCIKSGIRSYGLGTDEPNMGNCIRFLDDCSFDDVQRIDLEPFEMILSMEYATLRVPSESTAKGSTDEIAGKGLAYRPFLLVGTAYTLAEEDEPSRGRILVYSCLPDPSSTVDSVRHVHEVTELMTQGAVYSFTQFYDGKFLCTVGSKTQVVQLGNEAGVLRLQYLGIGHYGHIVSLCVRSRAKPLGQAEEEATANVPIQSSSEEKNEDVETEEKLAIVGDLMRSISLVQYYPQHETLEEVARDFTPNWTTALEMLSEDVYLGSENFASLFCLKRNKSASSPEIRCRLENIGEFHLGELINKFMSGSIVMPVSTSNVKSNLDSSRRASSPRKVANTKSSQQGVERASVSIGSQTLFGTAEGSLGVVIGLDEVTAAFLMSLERSMVGVIQPIGDFSQEAYRCCQGENRSFPAHGFIDGDLIESFLDLDRSIMGSVVTEMNRDGGWEVDDWDLTGGAGVDSGTSSTATKPELTVDDVLSLVEEISMIH